MLWLQNQRPNDTITVNKKKSGKKSGEINFTKFSIFFNYVYLLMHDNKLIAFIMWLNITDFLTPLKNIIIMSKVIIKAKKSGGLSSEFQNCNDSREVKLEIAPLDIISKQAVEIKQQIILFYFELYHI